MKDLKESVYHSAVVRKTLIKMSPPSLGKFDSEDGVK